MPSRRRFRDSLRSRLLVGAVGLLIIPWVGYRYLDETERFLRDAQDRALIQSAQAAAVLLGLNAQQLGESVQPGSRLPSPDLYLHDLSHAPQLDGYRDEWTQLPIAFADYSQPAGGLGMRVALGRHRRHAYLLLGVASGTPRYGGATGERVELLLPEGSVGERVLEIAPLAPGNVVARDRHGRSMTDVGGEWQEHAEGYTLELRLPLHWLGERFALRVSSRPGLDAPDTRRVLATAVPNRPLGRLVRPSEPLRRLLSRLALADSRVWVLDRSGWVLARVGRLDERAPLYSGAEALPWLFRQLAELLLRHPADAVSELARSTTRITTPQIDAALAGRAATHRRRPPGSNALVVSAAVPIHAGDGVHGVVLVEQTTNAILSLHNDALARLLLITLLLLTLVGLGLLGLATWLTRRIGRLGSQLDQAVSHDGRILGSLPPTDSRDELGDLQRGMAAVLARLKDYNRYLESMAARLAHEMRTPLAVLRTSLDNLEQSADPEEMSRYRDRARLGAERLDLILTRLREATRLEQAFGQAELEPADPAGLVTACIDDVRQLHPDCTITYHAGPPAATCPVAPEMIIQALEKILANAIDFHRPGSTIAVTIATDPQGFTVQVDNVGPQLPAGVDPFQSMISVRDLRGDEPHLGLGLYLVRLICEFHRGRAWAENTVDGVRVCMRIGPDHA